MTFAPYLTAEPHIQFHIAAAILALCIGPVALYRKRRDRVHKIIGYTWVTLMALVALSSFLITSFGIVGPFSPIHLLALWTLWSLHLAIKHVVAGNIAMHRLVMRNLYWYGLIIAGLFNFLPGRSTNALFFDGREELGLWVLGAGLALWAANAMRQKRRLSTHSKFPLEKPAPMV